jgi:enoyl-CoA hydratase/carnithine racemase
VQIIRMRRPDHGNRVSQKMAEEMIAALERARQSADVSACVLTGDGDVFCLGGDYQGAGPTSIGPRNAGSIRNSPGFGSAAMKAAS